MDALTVAVIVISSLLVLGFLFWVFIGLVIFIGAASMEDLHDDFPRDRDFETRKPR